MVGSAYRACILDGQCTGVTVDISSTVTCIVAVLGVFTIGLGTLIIILYELIRIYCAVGGWECH